MDAYTGMAEYALQVVTTSSVVDEPSGCLVGFATQCSIVPPRFLVCISKINHTYVISEHSESVALHLIGRDQIELAGLFAETSGDTVDKFSHCRWHPGVTGAPVLFECAAWLEGIVVQRWSVGDHQALLVRPVAGGTGGHRDVLTIQTAPHFRPGHPADG
jgi:flavin reductase (DIM6/NTAB) family NADH-FMN oxidoreductase RutF